MMSKTMKYLMDRFVGDDENAKAEIKQHLINFEIARQVYDARERAGLSQKELAIRVGTTQSVISRIEDADYRGHSLNMLKRIADALGRRLELNLTDEGLPKPVRRRPAKAGQRPTTKGSPSQKVASKRAKAGKTTSRRARVPLH